MTKFLQVANNKVVGAGECLGYQEGSIHYQIFNIAVSDEIFNAYIEDTRKVVYDSLSNQIILNPDYDEIIAREEKENRIRELKAQLNTIDLKSIRSVRDGDTEYIDKYKREAEDVREQLRELQA